MSTRPPRTLPPHSRSRTMSIADEIDESRSVAAEALRLARTMPDPALAEILREIAAIFGGGKFEPTEGP
jgi:hypothetical protein